MVKKKAQSKRISLHKKYKIIKKVNEHNRKLRKGVKLKKNVPGLRKSKKDPGIPNDWPFKEEVLQEIEQFREQTKREKEAEKERQKLLSQIKQKEHEKGTQEKKFKELQWKAERGSLLFEGAHAAAEAAAAKSVGNKKLSNDNSRRQFLRELKKIMDNADVLLQVLDARDPLGCRAEEVERAFLSSGPNKRVVLVLNKIDLIPREAVEHWLKYLRNFAPTIAFKASTQSQRHNLGHVKKGAAMPPEKTSECVGGDALLQLLKNYARNKGVATSITVGVVGYPNVGKSSLINSLKRSKVAQVGATPGVTKSAQEVHLDKNVKLLDCPGIVFAKDQTEVAAVLRNCVKIELVEDLISPVAEICKRVDHAKLMLLFSVPAFKTAQEFLSHVATQRGKLKRGGVPDISKAALMVLQDWAAGKIPHHVLPPAQLEGVHVDAAVVSSWGKEFDLASVETQQAAALQTFQRTTDDFVVVAAGERMQADMSFVDGGADAAAMEDEGFAEGGGESVGEAEDLMEDDEPVAGKRGRTDNPPAKKQQYFTEEEAKVNPQVNKQLKQQQKRARKTGQVQMQVQKDDDAGSDYDFTESFTGGAFAVLQDQPENNDNGIEVDSEEEKPAQKSSAKKTKAKPKAKSPAASPATTPVGSAKKKAPASGKKMETPTRKQPKRGGRKSPKSPSAMSDN